MTFYASTRPEREQKDRTLQLSVELFRLLGQSSLEFRERHS